MGTFKDYLISKKIDPAEFYSNEEKLFMEFKQLFGVMHENSFTAQKLFLINRIRRNYPLKEEETKSSAPTKPKPKPKIPRIKN